MEGAINPALWLAMNAYRKALTEKPVTVATRKASEMVLEVINAHVAEAIGGSADLTGSNNTRTKGMEAIEAGDFRGRFVHYGIREHGMAAAMNGMALHGGVVPYSGTFLVFADYCRPSIRLAALMGQRVIHVMTHDFDWPWRRRADASAGGASGCVAGRFRIYSSIGRPMRSRRRSVGNWRCVRRRRRA